MIQALPRSLSQSRFVGGSSAKRCLCLIRSFLGFAIFCSLTQLNAFAKSEAPIEARVEACGQTSPVSSVGDAADDPAIWIHPSNPNSSLILGTDKKKGLAAYDLDGNLKQFLELGPVNNVDLRASIRVGTLDKDLVVLSHRQHRSIDIVEIKSDASLSFAARIPTNLPDVYGICMHKTASGAAEVFINSKSGRLQHYMLQLQQGQLAGVLKQEWSFSSQIEGCVVDDATGIIFVGEEAKGVWAIPFNTGATSPRLVLEVGPWLKADVEGLALAPHKARGPLLIVSSQGDHQFVVLRATSPFEIIGRFSVVGSTEKGIDAVTSTDGIEVYAAPVGTKYPRGLMVVQDGSPAKSAGTQNFKIVCWEDVLTALRLN